MSETTPTIELPQMLTPAWIQTQLERLIARIRVADFTIEPVGAGQISATYRLTPTYAAGSPSGPRTMILKCPPSDAGERAVAQGSGSHVVEIRFYRELASKLDLTVPKYFGGEWLENGDYLLLIEDGAPAIAGDQIEGSTVDQAAIAIEEIARLHIAYWGAASADRLPWVRRRVAEWNRTSPHARMLSERFHTQYEGRVPDSVLRLGDRHGDLLEAYLAKMWTIQTLTHGDYRVDNLMFAPGSSSRVTVLDWGGAAEGPPLADIAYFVGGSLSAEQRRSTEHDLVRHYLDRLAHDGIRLDPERAWEEYRAHAISGLVMSTFAPVAVKRTDRGDTMFLTMADRYATQITDLGSDELVLKR
jgi:aminoglycoside phosphotransferase (APT) family kinase protein